MTAKRRYQLLCPVARALDAVGDRWSLLILRDLHAAPARFGELEAGLGLATNLLTTRLRELGAAGLVVRRADGVYELSEIGRASDRVLWELASFGSLVGRDPEPRPPGNVRAVALPLRFLLEAVSDRPSLRTRLWVDADPIVVTTSADAVEVRFGDLDSGVDLELTTAYEAVLDAAEGLMAPDEFVAQLDVLAGDEHLHAFMRMLGRAIESVGLGELPSLAEMA